MVRSMEMAEGEDRLLGDMLEVIRFTEGVSAKLHRVLDEAKIYQVVKEEFAKSDRYMAGILLLDGDGASLRLAEVSMPPSRLKVLERASGLQAREYRIKLSKSSICRQVVGEDKTVHANIGDIIREFLPRPLAYLISKTMGYDKQSSILTPLHRRGKVIGVLGVSCTDLCEYLLHSVENLALHISTALELADEYAQRKRAVQALKGYHDHLGELVEERTGELKAVNEKLRQEISERKEAEEALRKIEQEKLAILNSMSEIMVYQDTEHRILWTNKAAAESVALSIEQLVGRHCYEIWHQSDKPCDGCPVAKARETGKPEETERTTPDGRVWFIRGYPVQDANGNLVGVVEVVLDITERKRAEEALQAEKNKLQSLIDAMEDGLSIQDGDYDIIYQNEPVRTRHGDHLGEKCYRVYEGKEEVCGGCPVKRAFRDGNSHTGERRVALPSGEVTFWEVTANPIRDAGGKIVSCLEIARDVTQRKQAEEALRESQEKFQKMFESVTDGISVVDLNGAIIEANPIAVEMHGFASKDELLGRNALELIAPRDRERIAANMRKAVKEGAIRGAEYTLLKADGTEFPGELSTSVLRDASGKVVAHITIARDITRRKRAGEALRESEERFRSIVENSQAGIMILDDAYRLTYVNDELCRIAGYSPKEVIGQDFRKFLDEESQQLVAERYIRRQRGEEVPPRYEFNIIHKDSHKRRVEISSAVIKDSVGGVKTVAQILDVTERKRADEALQTEKNKLQSLIDAMEDSLSIRDRDYNIIYQNEVSKRRHGDHLGEKCYRVYEGNEKVCDGCPVEKAFKDGKSHTMERRVVLPSGEVVFWEVTSSPIRDAGGRIVSCLELARDITKRKQAEEALNLQRAYFQQLFDNSPDAIALMADGGKVVQVNKGFETLFGCQIEEVKGRYLFEVIVPEDRVDEAAAMTRVTHSGKALRKETVRRRKDGSLVDVSLLRYPIRFGSEIIGTYCIYTDITERKQAEEALRESQKFSSSLLGGSPNPISVVNLDTSIRYVNPALEKLTGFTLDEIVGRKAPYPWWPEGKRTRILAAFKDAIKHGGRRTERNFQNKNGEHFWVALNSAPVMQDGKAIYLIVSWLDITDRKQAEEKEKQLQQELYLAQRLASVGELAAGVAHEINNPLTGVLGFSQRLMRKSTDEEVRRDLEIIHSEARRAAEVVQSLLTFARRRQPKKEYANINDIVQKTLELRAYALQTGNIEVVTTLAPRLPRIMVDFPQMQEVFLNIILNAEQAMSEANGRGKLIIKARRLKDCVKISFADDGPGISPENLDKLFDPFFTTREERGGTGLGLSACHGIVTEHGGRIYARNNAGKGATFFVELPLPPTEAAVAH